jgi:hypothetical protein
MIAIFGFKLRSPSRESVEIKQLPSSDNLPAFSEASKKQSAGTD